MVTFKAELSPKSLENLIKELNIHAKKFEEAKLDIHQALADYAYEKILSYVPTDTGELKASFFKEASNELGRVYTDLYYAKFVEFGTGIIGTDTHPLASEKGWHYDVNQHGESGWVYQGRNGEWSWTKGQVGKNFMYKTVQDLEQDYIEITKNVLRKKGLI